MSATGSSVLRTPEPPGSMVCAGACRPALFVPAGDKLDRQLAGTNPHTVNTFLGDRSGNLPGGVDGSAGERVKSGDQNGDGHGFTNDE